MLLTNGPSLLLLYNLVDFLFKIVLLLYKIVVSLYNLFNQYIKL